MDILSVSTRERLLLLMLDKIAVEPNTPVSLSDLAHTLGVSRERVRVLYRQLASEYPFPPVKNKGSWSKEMRRKFTARKQIREQAVAEKVKALRDKGVYYKQIIHKHGILESHLWQATKQLRQTGETSRKLTSPQTLAFEAAVRKYRAQGMTGAEIAQKTGKHRVTVYAVLQRLDIPLSKRTRKNAETSRKLMRLKTLTLEAEVRAYNEQGMAVSEIARKIGRPAQTIYTILRRLGIPVNKPMRRSEGEKMPSPPLPSRKSSLPVVTQPKSSQLTKTLLLAILQSSLSTQPNTPVSLSKIARTLGVPRQRVHTLYHQLALDYPLPPVAKPGFGQLDQQTKLAIAKQGGIAVHAKGTAHRLTEEESKRAWQNSLLKCTQTRNSKPK